MEMLLSWESWPVPNDKCASQWNMRLLWQRCHHSPMRVVPSTPVSIDL